MKIVASCTILLICGCSGSNDNKSAAVDWTAGRGTEACHEWQQAFCELEAKCGSASVATCGSQVQTIQCASDTTAADCATSMAAATCSAMPAGCNSTDVADTAWAKQACIDYLTAMCTHNASCGSSTSVDTCVANQQTTSSCSKAIGVKLNYESCISQINAASCATQLATECASLIYVTP